MRMIRPNRQRRRVLVTLFGIVFVLSVLITAFFNTQVLNGRRFALQSRRNRLRPVVLPAPRGTIYDRSGRVVATSIPGFSVVVLPGTDAVIRRTLADLQPFLGLTSPEIQHLNATRDARPNDLLTVTEDATFSQVAAIEERLPSFPNLLIVERPKRAYPGGPALGHLTGYVAEITQEQLERPEYRKAGYRQGRSIGQAGLEKEYELTLSGTDGARFVEVDARGRTVNPRSPTAVQAPVPGRDLHLTLDLGLQKYLREIFPDTMQGAIAVLEPRTGEVLGLYSNPGYDPNAFVGGVPARLWRALQADPAKPLLDRTLDALYPPASTWKLATAAVGLERGIVGAETKMPLPCTGGMTYAGRYWRCWYRPGHGFLDLVGAIEKSCDVYFYQLGLQIGLTELIDEGTRMGFSRETGIDLPGERSGVFPTGLQWYKEHFGYDPKSAEVLSLAIGQGPNSQDVLRMAFFYSAIAGGGRSARPHVVAGRATHTDLRDSLDLKLSPASTRTMWNALGRVTEPGGTAYLSALGRWKLYGKTGTAQNPQGADHGWFAGFAGPPGKAPEVVAVAVVEHGVHGSNVAPLVAKAAEYYLDEKYRLPLDREPTLIERWESKRCPWGVNCVPGRSKQQ